MEKIQKKNKSIWKKILIFLIIYMVAKVLGGVAGRQAARREGYLTGNELKKTYKESHIKECVKVGSSEAICSCTFEGLIEEIGLEGYGEMAKVFIEKGTDSSEAEKYLNIMIEELLKCRQK